MTLKERLGLRLLGVKSASVAPPQALRVTGAMASWGEPKYPAFAREGYAGNPYVSRALAILQEAVGGVPWWAYAIKTETAGGKKKTRRDPLPDNHPLARLITTPNPQQSFGELLSEWTMYRSLGGESFLSIATAGQSDRPIALYNLRPDLVTIKPAGARPDGTGGKRGEIERYEYGTGTDKTPYPPEAIIHSKIPNPTDEWRGLSPLCAAWKSIVLNNEERAWNVALLQQGGFPGLVVYAAEHIRDQKQIDKIYEELERKYEGSRRTGRSLVLQSTGKVERAGLSPDEISWERGIILTAREVAIALGIPPQLLGDPEQQTYSNLLEARKGFYTETVLPLLDKIRDIFNTRIAPRFGQGLAIDYDSDAIDALRDDQEKLWARVNRGWMSGLLTLDQALEALGYEQVGGEIGGSRFVQGGVAMPLGDMLPLATPGSEGQAGAA